MAPFRKAPVVVQEQPRRAIVASAARYTFGGAQAWKGTLPAGDRRWQVEAWRHYDMCGELRYATGWKGNACAQALLYAADIDPDTGRPVGPSTNPKIIEIAGKVLGGPVKRPQHIRTMVLNLEMTGEVYVVVVARKGKEVDDTWLVVSGTELNQSGGAVEFTHPETGLPTKVGPKDTLIRIWNPHPRLQLAADSAVRALLPTLREIEKSSQNIAARLDSRLASAAAQVPIIFEVPAEFADAFKLINFESPLSKEIIELRADAIGRLAAGLDLPREVVEGMGDSNHWSAWQVAEETYRTHLVPILDVISDALTAAYLHPVAEAAGIPDVDTYMLAFDGSALIGEPDPLQQVLELLDRGLITPEAALTMLHIPEDYAPTGQDKLVALATQLVGRAPTLFENPVLQRILGFAKAPAAPAVEAAPQEPPVTASAAPARPVDIASLAVVHALERAGNRLLNTQRLKAEYADVPRHELHVKLRPDDRHGDLLQDAWRHVPELADRWDLDGYCRRLIAVGLPHDTQALAQWMASRGQ